MKNFSYLIIQTTKKHNSLYLCTVNQYTYSFKEIKIDKKNIDLQELETFFEDILNEETIYIYDNSTKKNLEHILIKSNFNRCLKFSVFLNNYILVTNKIGRFYNNIRIKNQKEYNSMRYVDKKEYMLKILKIILDNKFCEDEKYYLYNADKKLLQYVDPSNMNDKNIKTIQEKVENVGLDIKKSPQKKNYYVPLFKQGIPIDVILKEYPCNRSNVERALVKWINEDNKYLYIDFWNENYIKEANVRNYIRLLYENNVPLKQIRDSLNKSYSYNQINLAIKVRESSYKKNEKPPTDYNSLFYEKESFYSIGQIKNVTRLTVENHFLKWLNSSNKMLYKEFISSYELSDEKKEELYYGYIYFDKKLKKLRDFYNKKYSYFHIKLNLVLYSQEKNLKYELNFLN